MDNNLNNQNNVDENNNLGNSINMQNNTNVVNNPNVMSSQNMVNNENAKVTETKKNNKGIIIIVIMAIIIILIMVCVYFVFIKDNKDTENSQTTSYNDREELDYSDSSSRTKGDVINVYETEYAENKYSYNASRTDSEVGKLVGKYTCESNICKEFDTTSDYLIMYDNKDYFLYDYRNNKKTSINIPYQKYHNIYADINKSNKIVGVTLYEENSYEEESPAYYDINKKEVIINFGEYDSIYTTENLAEKGYVVVDNQGVNSLYEKNSKKIVKENIINAFTNGTDTYFFSGEIDLEDQDSIIKIYDSNFNIITEFDEPVYNYYFDEKTGELKVVYLKENEDSYRFSIIKNNKIAYTSNSYQDQMVLCKDYIVANKNNYLIVMDYEENEIANIGALEEETRINWNLSYITSSKVAHIYLYDNSILCSSLSREDVLKLGKEKGYEDYAGSLEVCEIGEDNEELGYEYQYNIETKGLTKTITFQYLY